MSMGFDASLLKAFKHKSNNRGTSEVHGEATSLKPP